MRLNVGCHDIKLPGFVNLDIDPAMNPDRVVDCTKLKETYEENSIDFIYCGHFVEHLVFEDSCKIVKDFHFILKTDGVVCCVVPDYTKISKDLAIHEAEAILLAAGQHKSIFNQERLTSIFKDAGFVTFAIDVKEIPWTPFPNVEWQSAVIAIKHVLG